MPRTDRSRPVSPRAHARLAAWANRKPRIALMGEFSSGKSTLLNLLIGEDLLPTKVTATEMPPVWFSHGAPRAFWVDRQNRRHPLGFGDFAGIPRSARYVRVFTPAPFLERCDLLDTPGISDPNLEDESWRFPVGQSNLILWCTPATQAWRETERSTWLSLPERLRSRSVLVVTRADKLATPGDREKVARRLSRESFGLFGGIMFLATPDAVRGRQHLSATGDASLWNSAGGADLEARIADGIASVRAERLELLERYRVGDVLSPVRSTAAMARPAAPEPVQAAIVPEPVRPRRVERPDASRGDRTPEGGNALLGSIRAGWRAFRSAEPEAEPVEADEPVPVLTLTDPFQRSEPPRLAEPAPVAPPRHGVSPAPATARDERKAEPASPASPIEDSIAAVLAADAEPAAAPVAPAPAQSLPRAVRIWRDIVARSPETPPNSPIVAMIDQLLIELSRDDQLSGDTGRIAAMIAERNQAA